MRKCEKYGRAGHATDCNIVRLVRFACWINKATNTFRIYNIYCYALTTMVARRSIDYPFIRTLPVLFISVTTVGVTPK